MWLQPQFEAPGGLLRFDRFMELALYDPDHGYYTRHLSGIGARGDFATSATLSDALGRAIAAWIRDHRPPHVIEVGAGTGQLAAAVRSALGLRGRFGTRYHIVERSPPLRAAQRQLLGRAITWHDTVPEALAACRGKASVFSNELVDAFPVRIFRASPRLPTEASRQEGLSELHLTLRNNTLTESFQPLHSLPDSTLFSHSWSWPEGQRLEVHHSYRTWLADLLPLWADGELLTIDYGGPPAEIYRRRPQGTLRGYLAHQAQLGAALYQNPGRLDLTADVNFDDLVSWGTQLGLETLSLLPQRDFLLPHLRPSDADRFLADPDGAGSAFKVLRQRLRPQ